MIWRQHIHKVVLVYLIPGRIGIWKCWFLRRREDLSTLGVMDRTNNKLNPHLAQTLAQTPGFETRPNWWEASALTTSPPFLSQGTYCNIWEFDWLLHHMVAWNQLQKAKAALSPHRTLLPIGSLRSRIFFFRISSHWLRTEHGPTLNMWNPAKLSKLL